MNQIKKAGIVACSNAVDKDYMHKMEELIDVLENMNIDSKLSECIYDTGFGFSGTGKERAQALMNFYNDEETDAIFDISGGDVGNEVLPYLDFDIIGRTEKQFWGYSDLTTIINAIYAKTGKSSVLYQVRNLIGREWGMQCMRFENTVCRQKKDLFDIDYDFLQGNEMEGIMIGGNIRCLLKLAGTEYWPNMEGKILFLEARSGKISQIVTYFSQLKQMSVFEQISGLLLGTFSELETCVGMPQVRDILTDYVDDKLPVAMTRDVGHGSDSKAVEIGRFYQM